MEPIASPAQHFCVVIHDVTPVYASEIDALLDQLQPLVGNCISGAVVPCWHNRHSGGKESEKFQDWSRRFEELLLHGWTHYQGNRPGLVSWLTARSDEFSGMSPEECRARIIQAQCQMESILTTSLRGFVAPAWQLPCWLTDIRDADIEYLLGFQSLVSVHSNPIPLATWSWDWGWLYGSSRLGALLGPGKLAWCPAAIPVVVLHPVDIKRRCVSDATRLIRRFLREGRLPSVPSRIAGCKLDQ